jgi:hypothetical protein
MSHIYHTYHSKTVWRCDGERRGEKKKSRILKKKDQKKEKDKEKEKKRKERNNGFDLILVLATIITFFPILFTLVEVFLRRKKSK